MTQGKQENIFYTILFALIILTYIGLSWILIWHIPYTFPFGGPDELMHLSMAEYISKHLSWPQWDSREVVRNAYGVSYSAGGSIVYWLHGLSYRLFGYHRIGAFALLLVYLLLAIVVYRKNRVAGYLLLASLVPQTLFIFSYVNSDSGTVITALLFGMAVGWFATAKEIKEYHFWILLLFAGLSVTARQHLWAIAFLTLIWALVYRRSELRKFDKRVWIIAFLLGMLPASWWFITSFLANDGDILGVFTNAKSIAKFGNPDLPSLARAWDDISLTHFLKSTFISLYANWGWMSLPLKSISYTVMSIIVVSMVVILWRFIDKRVYIFFIALLVTNFGFMLLYSTVYDYQAQGRYLFPSIYIIVGMLSAIMVVRQVYSKLLLLMLAVFSMMNIYFSATLTATSYMDTFLQKPALFNSNTIPAYKDAKYHIDQFQVIDNKLLARGWIFDNKTSSSFEKVSLIMRGSKQTYRVKLDKESRPDVAMAFGNEALTQSGFSVKLVDLKEVEKGSYDYFLLVANDNKQKLIPIGSQKMK